MSIYLIVEESAGEVVDHKQQMTKTQYFVEADSISEAIKLSHVTCLYNNAEIISVQKVGNIIRRQRNPND